MLNVKHQEPSAGKQSQTAKRAARFRTARISYLTLALNLLALLLGAVLRLSRLARSLLTLRSSGHRGGRVLAGTIRYRIRSSDGSSGSAGSSNERWIYFYRMVSG